MNGSSNGGPKRSSLTTQRPIADWDSDEDDAIGPGADPTRIGFVELPPPPDYSDLSISAFPDTGFDLDRYVNVLYAAFLQEAMRRASGNKTVAASLLRMSYLRFKGQLKRHALDKEE